MNLRLKFGQVSTGELISVSLSRLKIFSYSSGPFGALGCESGDGCCYTRKSRDETAIPEGHPQKLADFA